MTHPRQIILNAALVLALILLALAFAAGCSGCASPNGNAAVHAANGEIRATNAQIRVDASVIRDDAQKLWAVVAEKYKPIVEEITKRSDSITVASGRSDAATAKSDKAGDVMAADSAKKDKTIQKQNDSWGMRLEHFVNHVLLIGGIIIGVGVLGWTIFRVVKAGSLMAGGVGLLGDVVGVAGFAGGLLGKLPLIGRFFGGSTASESEFMSPGGQ